MMEHEQCINPQHKESNYVQLPINWPNGLNQSVLTDLLRLWKCRDVPGLHLLKTREEDANGVEPLGNNLAC